MEAREAAYTDDRRPRGSLVVPRDYARQVYVCDESGMPGANVASFGIAFSVARLCALLR